MRVVVAESWLSEEHDAFLWAGFRFSIAITAAVCVFIALGSVDERAPECPTVDVPTHRKPPASHTCLHFGETGCTRQLNILVLAKREVCVALNPKPSHS